jgi:hypothetical protein
MIAIGAFAALACVSGYLVVWRETYTPDLACRLKPGSSDCISSTPPSAWPWIAMTVLAGAVVLALLARDHGRSIHRTSPGR